MIVGEVALSVVLLAGAGLLVKSLTRLQSVNPGIDTRALSFRISLPLRYDTAEKVAGFFSDAISRLRSIPGASAAGATGRLALEGYSWTGDLFIDGRPVGQSPVMRISQPAWRFHIPIPPGSRQITLCATDAGDRSPYDLANWVDAGFVAGK